MFGDRLGLLAQLHADGSIVTKTDETWELLDGPVLLSEIYDGETVDTRLDDPDWLENGKANGKVEVLEFPSGKLIASDAPPVRRVLELAVKEVITTKSGKKVLDFGQSLVGWVRIHKSIGKDGDEITIRHAEVMEHVN